MRTALSLGALLVCLPLMVAAQQTEGVARETANAPAAETPAAPPPFRNDVTVTIDDLTLGKDGGFFATGLGPAKADPALPVVDPKAPDAEPKLLRGLAGRGVANGFAGIYYDNRDRDHSPLAPERFPQLIHLQYGPSLTEQRADYGLAGQILYPGIVLGNSSTAFKHGANPRSLSRWAMTMREGQAMSARAFLNNHLYVYPEHQDYDGADLFPVNWPFHVISQGSSYSDGPFVRALAATLGAFRPDTLELMRQQGLAGPTLQMILRRNLSFVNKPSHYFAGVTHRPVINGRNIRPARMVSHAAGIKPEDLPPMVRLEVLRDDFQPQAGLAQASEKLFDAQASVARIWRGFEGEKRMLLSVEDTKDPNGRPLKFTWRLLQGDPARVTITPVGLVGERAEITIRWHDAYDVPLGPALDAATRETSRVDIGVFADNGQMPSAPSILSIAFPTHQARVYSGLEDPSRAPVLEQIDYDAVGRAAAFDPVLYWSAGWTDHARYDTAGRLTGWRRVFADPTRAEETVALSTPTTHYRMDRQDGAMVLSFPGLPAEE